MSEETHIDVEGVQQVANRTAAAAQDFETALAALQGVLAGHDGCWGDDKIGNGFAANYVPNAKQILGNAEQLAKGAVGGTRVLQQTPEKFQLQDSESGKGIKH